MTIDELVRQIVRDELAKATPPHPTVISDVANPHRLYSVREAADILGVGKDYVYERIHTGQIEVVDLGDGARSNRRIAAAELQRFIEYRTRRAR